MNDTQTEDRQPPRPSSERLISLDQFRGYTVAGMLLVNFVGVFAVCPRIFQHTNDYASYADTIMPQFFFAVGFAFRLTFGRRIELQGSGAAYRRVVRRLLGLVLISLVIYRVGPRAETWQALTELGFWGAIAGPLKEKWFQTLMHIAVTGLWLVPVIRARPAVRVLWIVGSAAAHLVLSYAFNFNWVNGVPHGPMAIDGGPLGFLTWVIPAGVGTLACDWVVSAQSRWVAARMLCWAVVLMGLGYLLSCGTRLYDVPPTMVESLRGSKLAKNPVLPTWEQIEVKLDGTGFDGTGLDGTGLDGTGLDGTGLDGTGLDGTGVRRWLAEPPFVPPPGTDQRKLNYWMMSQRACTLSYQTFSAGLSLALYVLFMIVCDWCRLALPFFRTFGRNALAVYVLHGLVQAAVSPFIPKDSPAWYVIAGLLLFFWITWVFVRAMERQKIYLKV